MVLLWTLLLLLVCTCVSFTNFQPTCPRHDLISRPVVQQLFLDWLDSQQPSGVQRSTVQDMMKRSGLAKQQSYNVVITGATGGLGRAIVDSVLQLNGTVIAIDATCEALEGLPDSVYTIVSDFSDLSSVKQAAKEVLKATKRSQVDLLVNNAGISYPFPDEQEAPVSKQGYDLMFQVNYLSHFVLTEWCQPTRMVHVSSGFSWGTTGEGLRGTVPMACRGQDRQARHNSLAYPHSKLAQIWHAAAYHRRHREVVAVAACPSWAATGIAGNDGRTALQVWAYPTTPGRATEIAGPALSSILNAMYLPREEIDERVWKGGAMFGNAAVVETLLPPSASGNNHPLLSPWVDANVYPRVFLMRDLAIYVALLLQRWFFRELYYQPAAAEGSNVEGQEELYEWSHSALAEWLPTKSAFVR